jgi:hypothetical protein
VPVVTGKVVEQAISRIARVRIKIMPLPNGIDPKVLELLQEDDWPWDDWRFGFRCARRFHETAEAYIGRPPDLITHADLEDRGLINTRLNAADRHKALEWLKARIRSAPGLSAPNPNEATPRRCA